MKTISKIAATLLLVASIVPAAFAQGAVTKTTTTTPSGSTITKVTKVHPSGRVSSKTIKVRANGAKIIKKSNGRKGGYVHSTTVVTPTGKVMHRKGYYRHSTKTIVKTGV